MKLNKVEIKGKKVLVWPSHAEMTKEKEVVIEEEWPLRMIKPKSPKDCQWQKNKEGGGKPQRHPEATFDILMAKYKEHCDILTQDLIGLIEYSYHQGIPSFLEAHLQRTLGLSVLSLEQFQDG
jgi:hypothetical protein